MAVWQAYSVVGAEGHAAKAVELHTHVKEGGMMKMRRIDKIDVPAHGEVVLATWRPSRDADWSKTGGPMRVSRFTSRWFLMMAASR